ncbi:HpnM family protein [Nitrosospira sp. Nsp13]|uniref:HpnM family protein n=1 Tax=Nitrosospira sp. Nsp13 TaxID=1855332 RepID=UPI00087F7BCD|nr:HpnM family protein [Nitrosospira sp. Nsp13]SCY11541.1 phospholipid transport system substrate-binding protein [Nitrosospira sp. Nsp13]
MTRISVLRYSAVSTFAVKVVNMKVLRAIKSVLQFQIIVAAMLMVTPVSWAETMDSGSPEQVVSHLHESLIKAMREGEKLGYRGRLELLTPVINQTHDLDFIARTTLGPNWTQLSTAQQQTFTDVFRKLSIGTYAGWFKSHEGERFEFLERQVMPREQIMVRSRLVPLKGEPVRFDYILRQGKEGWRIVNILADGVSDLALKRVEYRAILQRDGFQTLIDMLKKKIALTEEE